jgi:hypothetical protein
VNAVQEAPEEVRNIFEETVDLFQGAFDEYKMLNQTITVGERRTVVAVNLVGAATAAVAAAAATQRPGGGGGGTPSPSTNTEIAAKREEEEETEAAGEIAGEGSDWFRRIKIYKEIDGVKVMDWKAFIKKFWFGILNLGFTISGSIVVYMTLSGLIQKITLITTLAAFAGTMYLYMKEPEE